MTQNIRLPEENSVKLVGRLTLDPKSGTTQKGTAYCFFDIAVNRRFRDQTSGDWKDDTVFVSIRTWGPTAEGCRERLKKGTPVHIDGRLAVSEYTDKSGQKRKQLQVVARRVQILVYNTAAGGQPDDAVAAGPAESGEAAPEADSAGVDDVPF